MAASSGAETANDVARTNNAGSTTARPEHASSSAERPSEGQTAVAKAGLTGEGGPVERTGDSGGNAAFQKDAEGGGRESGGNARAGGRSKLVEAKLKNALEAVEILRSVGGSEALGFAHSINLDGDEGKDAAKTEEGDSSRREWKV